MSSIASNRCMPISISVMRCLLSLWLNFNSYDEKYRPLWSGRVLTILYMKTTTVT